VTRTVTTMCCCRVSWRQALCRLNETLPTNGSHRFTGGWRQLLRRSRRRRASVQESAELTFGTLSAGWGASRAAGKNSIGIYHKIFLLLHPSLCILDVECDVRRSKKTRTIVIGEEAVGFMRVLKDDKLLGENIERVKPHILSDF